MVWLFKVIICIQQCQDFLCVKVVAKTVEIYTGGWPKKWPAIEWLTCSIMAINKENFHTSCVVITSDNCNS